MLTYINTPDGAQPAEVGAVAALSPTFNEALVEVSLNRG